MWKISFSLLRKGVGWNPELEAEKGLFTLPVSSLETQLERWG